MHDGRRQQATVGQSTTHVDVKRPQSDKDRAYRVKD